MLPPRRTINGIGGRAASLSAVLVLGLAACGGERVFTAGEFVDEMNANGAALKLGPVLTQNPEGIAVNEVTLTSAAQSATGTGPTPAESASASLLVLSDADAAGEEYDRCQRAASLTCYRAANVVLRVENLQRADQAQLTTAVEAIASG